MSSCRLHCSKANRHNDSPLHPTAEEDALVCGLCFISGTGRRNLLLDWYANTLPAAPENIFLEKEEPPSIISEDRLALDSLRQLCQQETGQLDRKRLKFRLVPHLLLLLMLKSQQGFLEVVIGQTCLLHLSHSLSPARLYLALNCQSKFSRLEKVNSIALEGNQFHLCSFAAGEGG